MVNRFLILFFIALIPFTTSCTARIDSLEKRLNSEVKYIRTIQAEQTATLNEIRNELRQLSGRIDESEHISLGKTKELESKLQTLRTRVPPPAGVPDDLLARDEEQIAKLSGDAADFYRNSLAQLREGDFASSEAGFSKFATDNPGTAFTDNALFWKGICSSKQGDYPKAVVAFSDVIQSYPAEDMVSPALFYLGETLLKLNSKSDAIITYQKLIDDHPRADYAERARAKLRELKPQVTPSKQTKPVKKR